MAQYSTYPGTAQQYINEYLDPDNTLGKEPTTESEAIAIWRELEETFADDGGTGIDENDFVEAVTEMQQTLSQDETEDAANASLIAAAPELLEALGRLLDSPCCNEDDQEDEDAKAIQQAINAIAKAEGR